MQVRVNRLMCITTVFVSLFSWHLAAESTRTGAAPAPAAGRPVLLAQAVDSPEPVDNPADPIETNPMPEDAAASGDSASPGDIMEDIADFVAPPVVEQSEVERAAEERIRTDAENRESVGQLRTSWGTIDLNTITLDQLYQNLDTQTSQPEYRITLENCLFIALDMNPDIRIAEYGPLKVDGDILSAKGEFDPTLSFSSTYNDSETTPSSQTSSFLGGGLGGGGGALGGLGSLLGGLGSITSALGLDSVLGLGGGGTTVIVNESFSNEISLRGKIPTGTQYEVRLNLSRDVSTFNNFESEYSGGATLTITQPLMKGAGFNYNLFRIRSAKNNRITSEYRLRQQVENTLSEVMRAYWDLVGAKEQLAVRQRSLENARRLRENNERRLELGQVAAHEVIQAKASEATRLSELVSARNQVVSAEDRLRLLLDAREETELATARLMPVDRPAPSELNLDLPESIDVAMENHVEILTSEVDIATAELDVKRKRNEMLPQIDLQGSYNRGARGPERDDVFDGLHKRRDTTWSIGLQGSVPITNRAARGAYMSSKLSKRESELRLEKIREDVEYRVRNAVRNAVTSRVQLEANRQARALQETNVEAEEKKQSLGISTSFEVLRIQEDLANAQVSEVQSTIELEKALIDISLAQGTLLTDYGITLEMPEPATPVSFIRSITPGLK